MNESGVTPTLAEIYGDVEYVLRDDGDGVFEVSYPRSRKTPRRVIGRIRDEQFFPANEWREPTGRGRGQAGRDDVDFLTGKRTAPDPPAASVYEGTPLPHGIACGCSECRPIGRDETRVAAWRQWLDPYVRFANATCSFVVAGYVAWRFWPW